MSDERLDACRRRLHLMQRGGGSHDDDLMQRGGGSHDGEMSLEARADALEFVHRSLVAELDDLRDGDRRG